ncbi:MAG: F0F1 ATP synthase subunit A [Anaerolineaceae bacterium]|nr:F0F1 ATP synthase subunit A [Anaerolineaceae bacterium]
MEKTRKWRWGKNRWFVLFFILLGAFFAARFPPVAPHIQVAPEKLSAHPLFTLPVIGDFYLTNTLVASFVVYLILIVLAFFVRRAATSGEMIPKGISGAMEALIETLYNLTESTAGHWAKSIFPWFATIVLVVLLSNWLELIPLVDSFGFVEHTEKSGSALVQLLPNIFGVVKGTTTTANQYVVVPFLRVPSTDLNFTVALAVISVVMTQVIGIRAQGMRYFSKFFNTTTLFKKPLFGAIDFAVGILETISEMAKLLSFSFRLFGNIFAGSVLLFLVGSLVPIFAQSAVLLFEFFIGLIQALVFGMLTMVFMAQATQGHGGEHALDTEQA